MKHPTRITLAIVLLLSLVSVARAQVTLWTAHGTVASIAATGTPSPWTGGVDLGTSVELKFYVDHDPVMELPLSGIAFYDTFGATLTIGGTSLSLMDPGSFLVGNDGDGPLEGYGFFFNGVDSTNDTSVSMNLWSSMNIPQDLSVPLLLPALSNFDLDATITVQNVPIGGSWTAIIDLDTASVTPVPEPSTYGLIGAAVLAGVITLRRRRRA